MICKKLTSILFILLLTGKIYSQETFWYDGFETDKGWVFSGDFERTTPQGLGDNYYGYPDPSAAYERTNCIGTDLITDGNYAPNATSIATSPVIDCSSYTKVILNFKYWLNVEDYTYDQATIEVYNGTTWTIIGKNTTGADDIQNSWLTFETDVSSYAAGNANFQIRFKLVSDAGKELSGWNIDKIWLTTTGSCPVFSEDFESYTTGNLSQTNDTVTKQWVQIPWLASVNNWAIGSGVGALSGTQGLTINDGSSDASYNNTDDAKKTAYYYAKIDGRNYRNLNLAFKWKADGEAAADYGQVGYSTNSKVIYDMPTTFSGQAASQNASINFSAADEKSFYMGYKWTNDGNSLGNNPALTIDDINLSGEPYINYGFSSGTTDYNHISGTVLSFDANGGANISLPADFNFNYLGTIYASIRVSKYGWIQFYNTSPSFTSIANVNELLSTSYKPLIAPLWDNLSTDGQSSIIYRTDDVSPNRVFTIEYRDVIWGGARANFQVKLYETTHVIEFIYGQIQTPSTSSASIGINGMCQTVFMSVTPASSATVSMDIPNNTIRSNTYLSNGLIYTFSPYALQPYNTMQGASLLIGQTTWADTSSDISTSYLGQRRTPGASSSAVSAKNVLVVGSRTKNRVLLWNNIPSSNGAPADIVLGQTDFISSASATGSNGLNGVTALAFSPDGNKLIIADGVNNRILIWNSIPTVNGQAADIVIGQPDFTTVSSGTTAAKFNRPTGVLVTISGKMIVTDHYNNRVLIFNQIPTTNGASADVVIGQTDFVSSLADSTSSNLNYPWDTGVSPDGKLLISDDQNNRILIFNQIPTTNGAAADYVIGQTTFNLSAGGTAANKFLQPNVTVSPEGKLACGDWGNNRVLIFNRVPTENGALADEVLAQDAFTESYIFSNGTAQSTPDSLNMYHPYSVNFDLNGRLLVNGRDMNRVILFGEAPSDTSDLSITINSKVTGSICMGSPVSLNIKINNNGPKQAQNVVAKAALPTNFNYISSSFNAGNYNKISGFWTIPAIPAGSSYTLTINGNIQTNSGAAETITAYANITSTLEIDNNFSNNSDNVIFSVINNHAPSLSTSNLTDTVIAINASTGARTFGISDTDGDAITLSHSSSNTNLVPNDNTHIVISAISAGSSDINILPASSQYGYSTIELIATDVNLCQTTHSFKLSVGNIWEGDDLLKNTDWATAANWSGGVPSSTLEAIIPSNPTGGGNFPIISADASTHNLTIEEGANLSLNDGFKLDVYGNVLIKSSAVQTGSFTDLNTQANITAGKGLNMLGTNQTTTVQRYITGEAWHYLSMPIASANSDIFTKGYTGGYFDPNFYSYDETNIDADWKAGWTYAYNADKSGLTLTPAKGYAYLNSGFGDNVVAITGGNLNSGDISIAVTHTTGSAAGTAREGWNLIGNPYPSGLNADAFINLNANTNGIIDGTIYLWDEAGTGGFGDNSALYAYYNSAGFVGTGSGSVIPDKYISSGQAFFVHVSGSGGNVQYLNSMRETENSYFFKSTEKQNKEAKIALAIKNPEGKYNETLLAFLENASKNFDSNFDAYKLRDQYAYGKFAFYSLMGKTEMAIQSLPPIQEEDTVEINLGFETSLAGIHTFYFRGLQNIEKPIYLIDSYENRAINLKNQNKYLFNSEAGKFNERFIIHIGNFSSINENNTEIDRDKKNDRDIKIYASEKKIFLKQKKGIYTNGNLEIFSISGQKLMQFKIKDDNLNIYDLENLKQGCYLLLARKGNMQYKQKIILQ